MLVTDRVFRERGSLLSNIELLAGPCSAEYPLGITISHQPDEGGVLCPTRQTSYTSKCTACSIPVSRVFVTLLRDKIGGTIYGSSALEI
jgi:hypothetical protein